MYGVKPKHTGNAHLAFKEKDEKKKGMRVRHVQDLNIAGLLPCHG